jgi:hypothetical protein
MNDDLEKLNANNNEGSDCKAVKKLKKPINNLSKQIELRLKALNDSIKDEKDEKIINNVISIIQKVFNGYNNRITPLLDSNYDSYNEIRKNVNKILLDFLEKAENIKFYERLKRGRSRLSIFLLSRIVHTGPLGGLYFYNSNGNKTYLSSLSTAIV